MKGKIRVQINHRKLNYDFELKRNITIINGCSATGKTSLISYIETYNAHGPKSGVKLICDKKCVVLTSRIWNEFRPIYNDCILFLDENCDFVTTVEFAKYVKESNCYFVIIKREKLEMLAYSVDEIYDFELEGKTNKFKRRYADFLENKAFTKRPELVITEDSNSDNQFYQCIKDLKVISAKGKSNIVSKYLENQDKKLVLVFDGAAFGSCISELVEYSEDNPKMQVYSPESFEYFILTSGLFDINKIYDKVYQPYDYINTPEYLSWERYYTKLLVDFTFNDDKSRYNKSELRDYYKKNVENILNGHGLNFLFQNNVTKMNIEF